MENIVDFAETSYNKNGKPWKSSKILRKNPNFFISSIFLHFLISLFSGAENLFVCLNFVPISFNISHKKIKLSNRLGRNTTPLRPLLFLKGLPCALHGNALAGLAVPAFFFIFRFSSFSSFLFFHLSFLWWSKNFAVSGGTDLRPLFFFSVFFSPF